MRLRPISEMPRDHRYFRGLFSGETADGHEFRLEVSQVRRRRNGHELVRAHMNSTARGRPMSTGDIYKDVVEIALIIPGQRRFEVEPTASGMYRYGRHLEKTLPEIVERIVGEYGRRPSVAGPTP